jgi:SAM-dependent methyltransferase
MVYTFELIKHANIRYRDSLCMLSRFELTIMLRSLSIRTEIREETIGGAVFLTFECRNLSESELSFLSSHSAVVFMAQKEGQLLRPLSVPSNDYLPDDLPEILKYKGKTSVTFTRMMINVALSLSDYGLTSNSVILYDPLCGKGTTCFCALTAGMNAVGLDQNKKEIKEAADYFTRYLKYHRLKHSISIRSETSGKETVPLTDFFFANSKERFQSGDLRQLSLACADSGLSFALFRRRPAHILVADFPYGVQHAASAGGRPETLQGFLLRVLPAWKKTLAPGGAIALSFNALTLPSSYVRDAFLQVGFVLPEGEEFCTLRHDVEQAVVRDVIFALNTKEE